MISCKEKCHVQGRIHHPQVGTQCVTTAKNTPEIIKLLAITKYSGDLNTKLVWFFKWSKVVSSLNGPVFKCHLNIGLNLIWYLEHHLKNY